MLSRIHELDNFKYYFQFTITPYGKDIEKNLPDKTEIIIPAFKKKLVLIKQFSVTILFS